MSEFARLESVLSKLRQKEQAPGTARRLAGGEGDSRLASLVTEIDETVLPRMLRFETSNGTFTLAVANRRLQALMAPAPDGVPADLAGHALPDAEDPKLAELGTALRALLEKTDQVRISSKRLTENFGSDIGVPAEQLPRVWSVAAPSEALPGDVLTGFLDSIDTKKVAWLRIEGENVTDQGGPDNLVDGLGDQAAIFLDGYFGKYDVAFREPSVACGTLIASGASGASAAFFVEIGELSAIIVGPTPALLDLATAWQKLTAH